MSEPFVASPEDVFINCPFDGAYAPTFEALVFTVFACGFRPRSARELEDASQTRIDKLYAIIEQCRFGVHDLSRTELDPANYLPRFNMPLELGIFLGAKRYGSEEQRTKRCLILDTEPYRYQRFISDLNGMDIQDHGADPRRAVGRTRNWLANVSRRRIAGETIVIAAFDRFAAVLPDLAVQLGFARRAIPYVDFEGIVTTWLQEPGD